MANGTFEDLMAILETVPGNKEERTSLKVVLADQIYKERKALGLTQSQLVEKINQSGEKINQATISKIESAENDIKISTYEKVINALGIIVTVSKPSDIEKSVKNNFEDFIAEIEMADQCSKTKSKNYNPLLIDIPKAYDFYKPVRLKSPGILSDDGAVAIILSVEKSQIKLPMFDLPDIESPITGLNIHNEKLKEKLFGLTEINTPKRTQVSSDPYFHRVAAKKYKGNYEKEIDELESSK